jgi:ABC-type transport system involved in multi-copper enzyme maturation permease subunit
VGIAAKGYTHWEGSLRGRTFRWLTIARWGVTQTGRSKWLRRLVIAAWLPLLWWTVIFFIFGWATDVGTLQQAEDTVMFKFLKGAYGGALADSFVEDPKSFRPMLWSALIYYFLRYTQLFLVMLVVAVVGPKLVSEDLQSRSLALYFSKPLTRFDYVAGKLCVVAFWVAMVTVIPTLVLYGLSVLASPSIETLAQTWTVVPRVLVYSVLLMLATGAPMLALSSLTHNTRFLGFLWAGIWIMSHVASGVLSLALTVGRGAEEIGHNWTGLLSCLKNLDSIAFRLLDIDAIVAPATALSPRAAQKLADLSYDHDWRVSLALVVTAIVGSLVVVTVRIGRPGEAGSK